MAVTNYYSANGELYGESAGGVMTTYMTDALGSTIGTFQSGAVVNSYAYSPYGLLLSKTGTGADPRFLWNGASGYRGTTQASPQCYVYGRTLDLGSTSWTTVDRLWPAEWPYSYTGGQPVTYIDVNGFQRHKGPRKHHPHPMPPLGLRNPIPPPENYPLPLPPDPTTEIPPTQPEPQPQDPLSECFELPFKLGLTLFLAAWPTPAGPTKPGWYYWQFPDWLKQLKPNPNQRHCDDLHEQYKAQCRKCRSCVGGTSNFGMANCWLSCATERLQYIMECDAPGGGRRMPASKECTHALEVCKAFAGARNCIGSGSTEFPNPDYTEAMLWCREVADTTCRGFKHMFPPLFGGP